MFLVNYAALKPCINSITVCAGYLTMIILHLVTCVCVHDCTILCNTPATNLHSVDCSSPLTGKNCMFYKYLNSTVTQQMNPSQNCVQSVRLLTLTVML